MTYNIQENLKGKKLIREHNFKLVYVGPSFESGIKINFLVENLKAIHELVHTINEIDSKAKKNKIKEIRVIPKKGSIEEEIVIIFSNPEVRSMIVNIIIALFFYLIGRRDNAKNRKEIKEMNEKLNELISLNQLKNIKELTNPLEQKKDSLKIIENNSTKLEVNYQNKKLINKSIKEIEKEIKKEETEVELEGYISAMDLDTKRLKFHPKNDKKAYPLSFTQPLKLIIPLLGKEIKAKLRVTKIRSRIIKLHLLDYKLLQRGLNEFTE